MAGLFIASAFGALIAALAGVVLYELKHPMSDEPFQPAPGLKKAA